MGLRRALTGPEAGAGRPRGPPKQQKVDMQRVKSWGPKPPGARSPSLGNDPSAGSPTETLLRLLLPLNDQV